MQTINAFRGFRIILLLLVLFFVAGSDWIGRHRSLSWDAPIWVALYPINSDGTETVSNYIASLERDHFSSVEQFFAREAKKFNLSLERPIRFRLADQISTLPPAVPQDANPIRVAWWSLKFRYWAWRHANYGSAAEVHLFLQYFDPKINPTLAHSFGLQKGRAGVVNLFASRNMVGSNQVIIAHETLHTFGATDKYDVGSGLPIFPSGYAEPNLRPLYPQRKAELMGGRKPLSEQRAAIPKRLHAVLIGPQTASEIRWVKN
ncbi:MAG TPA: hypothetical protein DCZ03_14620 [Gammaproteobacteria bacterium]|nr:hypothetical protein [Gammaproteobacteria bacterium]